MNKAVMLSVQPQRCSLIATREQTIDIRKTKPKLEMPFKCYIYCTKGNALWISNKKERPFCAKKLAVIINAKNVGGCYRANGKVIGEFVCDRIRHECEVSDGLVDVVLESSSCMDYREILEYANGAPLYSWHISSLVIYDKPKELSEFKQCHRCPHVCVPQSQSLCKYHRLQRPPQSWCYVEELKGDITRISSVAVSPSNVNNQRQYVREREKK